MATVPNWSPITWPNGRLPCNLEVASLCSHPVWTNISLPYYVDMANFNVTHLCCQILQSTAVKANMAHENMVWSLLAVPSSGSSEEVSGRSTERVVLPLKHGGQIDH